MMRRFRTIFRRDDDPRLMDLRSEVVMHAMVTQLMR